MDAIQDLNGEGQTTLAAAIEEQSNTIAHAQMHAHDDSAKMADHQELLNLMPRAGEPSVAVALNGGSWFDPATWSTGKVPQDGENVYIPEGISVVYDQQSDARLDRVGVDGELHFAVDTDTRLVVDTLLTNRSSVMTIGVDGNPVQDGVNAEIVIHRDNGPIDLSEDPSQFGKGVVTHGAVRIAGQDKTDHIRASVDPSAGDTSLTFSEAPDGWQVGDKIVVAGTKLEGLDQFQDEVVAVTGIEKLGNGDYQVSIDRPLDYDHSTPQALNGVDFSVPVANYTRNISIGTEISEADYFSDGKTVPIAERGHVMFMHNGDVSVQNAEFVELGRTDKTIPTEDGNEAGRYALHFHRTGGQAGEEASLSEGNAVWGSPGWGIVHHDANLDVISNAVYGVNGAAIVAEAGSETGVWSDNITINTTGEGPGPKFNPEHSRDPDHPGYEHEMLNDTYDQGVGYAFKSRMVENFDNIAASSSGAGYLFWPLGTDDGSGRHMSSDPAAYEAEFGYDPFYGQDAVDASEVPLRAFVNNEAIATPVALATTNNKEPSKTDVTTVIDGLVGWEVNIGVVGQYQRNYLIENGTFVASDTIVTQDVTRGVMGHEFTEVKLVENSFRGFQTGIWEDNNSTSDPYNHVILGNHFEDVGSEMTLDANAEASRYLVQDNSADWAEKMTLGQLNATIDQKASDLVMTEWFDPFSVVVNKTDSLGTQTLTFGSGGDRYSGAHQKAWWSEHAENVGYYTSEGRIFLVVDIAVSDRLTGEAGVTQVPIELGFVASAEDLPDGAKSLGALPEDLGEFRILEGEISRATTSSETPDDDTEAPTAPEEEDNTSDPVVDSGSEAPSEEDAEGGGAEQPVSGGDDAEDDVTTDPPVADGKDLGSTTTSVFAPYSEWIVENPSVVGNAYDVDASVTFVNQNTGETIETGMFYNGSDYAFRFTGTSSGEWTFTSASSDEDLDGITGRVSVGSDDDARGFIVSSNGKFAQQNGDGSLAALLPNYVMIDPDLSSYADDPSKIDDLIDTYLNQHGFTGFHIPNIGGQLFDIDNMEGDAGSAIGDERTNPDPETFAVLERIISKTHEVGGAVHLWPWGDSARQQTPDEIPGGENGEVHQRLLEYVADRLGPLPGWTMGYGFDSDEWTSPDQVAARTQYFDEQSGYEHLLGVRAPGPNSGLDHSGSTGWAAGQDFADFEHHEPEYETYVAALDAAGGMPVQSGDRFRIRGEEGEGKDYTAAQTVDGLWASAMAGGVSNIWGNLTLPDGSISASGNDGSFPYPTETATQISTWQEFMLGQNRFALDMERANDLTGGEGSEQYALLSQSDDGLIVYAEDTSQVRLNLAALAGDPDWGTSATVIAVDTEAAYKELSLGNVALEDQTLSLDAASDWALYLQPSDGTAEPTDPDPSPEPDVTPLPEEPTEPGDYPKRLEVEEMTLDNYDIRSVSDASGSELLRVISKEDGVATASVAFDGASGTYDFTLRVYDEHDGQGSVSLLVGDTTVETWTLDADNDAYRTVSVEGVDVAEGEALTVLGRSDVGERARIDYLEIANSETDEPVETPEEPVGNFAQRFEAEAMSLENYAAEDYGRASGGSVARLIDKSIGEASATMTFDGPAGLYDLDLAFVDEFDGNGDVFLFVDDAEVGTWSLDGNDNTVDTGLTESVALETGSVIQIVGQSDDGERARVDYLDIMSAGTDADADMFAF